MNLLFVCGTHLDCNSGAHIFNHANHLAALGHACVVAVGERPEATAQLGDARFVTLLAEHAADAPRHFPDGAVPALVLAWTPRENVRRTTEELAARFACPYVVHLEDNEEHLLATRLGRPLIELLRLPQAELDRLVPPHAAHPLRARAFLAGAAGVTALIDKLLEFKPANVPGCVFWPGFDPDLAWGCAPDPALRVRLGILPHESVVAYTGNVHHANRAEVASLYLAVALVNRRGLATRLVRTGVDTAPLFDEAAGAAAIAPHVLELGTIPRAELPRILALADVCVQPGGPGPFNDYRFPSKLPEYFAAGRAVILPRSNLGRHLTDGIDARLTARGDAVEIAVALEELLADAAVRTRMGESAARFARENFSWAGNALAAEALYNEALRVATLGRASVDCASA